MKKLIATIAAAIIISGVSLGVTAQSQDNTKKTTKIENTQKAVPQKNIKEGKIARPVKVDPNKKNVVKKDVKSNKKRCNRRSCKECKNCPPECAKTRCNNCTTPCHNNYNCCMPKANKKK